MNILNKLSDKKVKAYIKGRCFSKCKVVKYGIFGREDSKYVSYLALCDSGAVYRFDFWNIKVLKIRPLTSTSQIEEGFADLDIFKD